MDRKLLVQTARDLVTDQKGILAADESDGTIKKRFDTIGVESTPDNHRRYRELLFTTPGITEHISGVILFDETIRQNSSDGTPFPKLLKDNGVIPGIKVDKGTAELANFPDEKATEGLDGLRERLTEYKNLGARFAKWRAVYPISQSTPTRVGMEANAIAMAQYAALCQEADIVPIVEPEVLMEGNHTIEKCAEITIRALEFLYAALFDHKVIIEGMLLKTNMVLPGKESKETKTSEEIAEKTLEVMREAVSVATPSVVFLSGGQGPVEATVNLNAINLLRLKYAKDGYGLPWELNFSYGRALQEPALIAWGGKDENISAAQKEFIKRARLNSLALKGEYEKEMEDQ